MESRGDCATRYLTLTYYSHITSSSCLNSMSCSVCVVLIFSRISASFSSISFIFLSFSVAIYSFSFVLRWKNSSFENYCREWRFITAYSFSSFIFLARTIFWARSSTLWLISSRLPYSFYLRVTSWSSFFYCSI